MAHDDDNGFFDRLGEILNAPLPGTRTAPQEHAGDANDPSLLERIKEILNAPLPGTPEAEPRPSAETPATVPPAGTAGGQVAGPSPEIDEDDLAEDWWRQEWATFRAHQEEQRHGLELKQRADQDKFAAYQLQEKQRFESHQQGELTAFRQQQAWRLNAWRQAAAASPSQKPPPPPWGPPPGPPMMPPSMPGPAAMGPPPWMRGPGPWRRG